jgi:hypothetical protein
VRASVSRPSACRPAAAARQQQTGWTTAKGMRARAEVAGGRTDRSHETRKRHAVPGRPWVCIGTSVPAATAWTNKPGCGVARQARATVRDSDTCSHEPGAVSNSAGNSRSAYAKPCASPSPRSRSALASSRERTRWRRDIDAVEPAVTHPDECSPRMWAFEFVSPGLVARLRCRPNSGVRFCGARAGAGTIAFSESSRPDGLGADERNGDLCEAAPAV